MKLKEFYEKIYNKIFSIGIFKKLLKIPGVEKLLQYEVISYLFFGVMTTVVNFIVYWLCSVIAGKENEGKVLLSIGSFELGLEILFQAIAWIAAVLFAFITNKLFVFESNSKKAKVLVKEIISFFGARILSFIIFEELVFILLLNIFSMNDMIAKLIVAVFVVIFNYIASKLVIFRQKGDKNA